MEEFVSFKNAALRMLERLSQDTAQIRKREGWVKVMGLVEDLEEDRAGWMADMLVSTVPGVDYTDKIGESFGRTHSNRLWIRALRECSEVEYIGWPLVHPFMDCYHSVCLNS